MKKTIFTILFILIIVAAVVVFILKGYGNNNINNNQTLPTHKDVINIEQDNGNDYYIYKKLEIDPNTNKAKFYFERTDNIAISNQLRLYIYAEENLLDTFILDVYGKNDYVEFEYEKNLDNATSYNVEMISGNASIG